MKIYINNWFNLPISIFHININVCHSLWKLTVNIQLSTHENGNNKQIVNHVSCICHLFFSKMNTSISLSIQRVIKACRNNFVAITKPSEITLPSGKLNENPLRSSRPPIVKLQTLQLNFLWNFVGQTLRAVVTFIETLAAVALLIVSYHRNLC